MLPSCGSQCLCFLQLTSIIFSLDSMLMFVVAPLSIYMCPHHHAFIRWPDPSTVPAVRRTTLSQSDTPAYAPVAPSSPRYLDAVVNNTGHPKLSLRNLVIIIMQILYLVYAGTPHQMPWVLCAHHETLLCSRISRWNTKGKHISGKS